MGKQKDSGKLQDIITSRVRVKVLTLFYGQADEYFYVREATRLTGEEINAVRRELVKMTADGVLTSETRGNRVYYRANKAYPFFPEIQQMIFKQTGLGARIRKMRRKLGKVDFVLFTSQFFNHQAKSDALDILVIGDIVVPELELLIKEEEKKIGREINFTIFDNQEFRFRKQRRDPFIMDTIYGKRIMIIGDEEAFVERPQFA